MTPPPGKVVKYSMHSHPFVSIIMPTYNRAGYIIDTIRSIQAQTYTNWELLIIDDGSDDNTGEIVSALHEKRIVYEKKQRIGRVSNVRNVGLRLAKGALLAFIDSDDLWHPEKLQKQIAALQRYPDAGYVLTNGYNFCDPAIPQTYFNKRTGGEEHGNLFLKICEGHIAAFAQVLLMRRELLNTLEGFSEDFRDSTFDFLGRLAHSVNGVYLCQPLFYRRMHDANVNTEHEAEHLQYYVDTIKVFSSKMMLTGEVASHVIFKAYLYTGEWELKQLRKGNAVRYFLKAWRYKPVSIIALKKIGKALLT